MFFHAGVYSKSSSGFAGMHANCIMNGNFIRISKRLCFVKSMKAVYSWSILINLLKMDWQIRPSQCDTWDKCGHTGHSEMIWANVVTLIEQHTGVFRYWTQQETTFPLTHFLYSPFHPSVHLFFLSFFLSLFWFWGSGDGQLFINFVSRRYVFSF